jgi:hypothetical protein
VARGEVAAARDPRRLGVALLPRPRLQVAGAIGAARAAHVQLHAEPLAQRRAVGRVRCGGLAQAVVDVQRGDILGARDPDGEVEQADRVASAREQHEHGPAGLEQSLRADLFDQVGHGSTRLATKSSAAVSPAMSPVDASARERRTWRRT